MRCVTAIEKDFGRDGEVFCFLAGGITNCPDWQKDVIEELNKIFGLEDLVIFNPRRENFPIGDPNASFEQITWEFDRLQIMNIFSMFFCAGDSDQPICMYELGRNLMTMLVKYPKDYTKRLVISCENGYKRKQDVEIQTKLATGEDLVTFSDSYDTLIKEHAKKIASAYFAIKNHAFN